MSATSVFVSRFPLRVRFSLVVAAIAAGVVVALWWLSLRIGDRQDATTLWFVLSATLLVTLLVDQAVRRLVFNSSLNGLDVMRAFKARTQTGKSCS